MRLTLILTPALLAASTGCNWINPRSNFERDPFVMSHLTKGSPDGGFASDEAPVRKSRWRWFTASNSKPPPPNEPNPTRLAAQTAGWDVPTHDPDYSWIVGRLRQRRGAHPQWYVEYARPGADPYNGEIDLEPSPELGLVREGDRVRIEGRLQHHSDARPRYRIENLARLD
jgi:hypothetical protein